MAGICGIHYGYEKDCRLCNAIPEDIFGKREWDDAKQRALAAGVHQCRKCKFVYYKTTELCPKCSHRREDTIITIVGSWWTAVKNFLRYTVHWLISTHGP